MDAFYQEKGLDILSLGIAATSPVLKELKNGLTYGPSDLYSALVFYLIFKDFQMKQVKILLEPNSVFDLFFQDWIILVTKQASLLNIPISLEILIRGKDNYNIPPKTAILLLATTPFLLDFVNPRFLDSIGPKSYIFMTDANGDMPDIFDCVPAFPNQPFPLDYTSTSQQVYQALSPESKLLASYFVYPFYDILFVLNRLAEKNLPIDKFNYRNVNAYDETAPAWASNNLFDLQTNFIPFGNYSSVFTKDTIAGPDLPIYLRGFKGGHLSLPQSESAFLTAGIRPYVDNLIYYDQNPYYRVFKKESLIASAFANDSTAFPPAAEGKVFIFGSTVEKKFIFKFNSEGFFSVLELLLPKCGPLPQVNLRMSKKTITLHL